MKLQNSYAQLPEIFYEKIAPVPVAAAQGVIFNFELAAFLGIGIQKNENKFPAELLPLLAGNQVVGGSTPLAQAYAGHQFGHFNKLGDGRAVLLGELTGADGKLYDLQLKGSGPTSFSRRGDGRAALGPMLREFIMSEAMFNLGVPTTRSLAVVATGEIVNRERPLAGAVLSRVAGSHLRVGTFEYAAAFASEAQLRILADYAIGRHAPELTADTERYLKFFEQCVQRQVLLVSQWMGLGFIHGVMNTDNMSIAGETIDYGPCAFMDRYDPLRVFSSIDREGRYAYARQPGMAAWNLTRLAEALLPLFAEKNEEAVKKANAVLENLPGRFQEQWMRVMRSKLGLSGEDGGDGDLIRRFLELLQKYDADYTNSFIYLSYGSHAEPWMQSEEFVSWQTKWKTRLQNERDPQALMRSVNPVRIPRNHRVEKVLRAAESGELQPMHNFLEALKEPYKMHTEFSEYEGAPDELVEKSHRTFCGT